MQASNAPTKVPLPFASSGSKNTIPATSLIGITAGGASLPDGFPPLTMTAIAAGGVAPAGKDFNGIFFLLSAIQQWQSAGGGFAYDSTFSTAIAGYPKGAVLVNSDQSGLWFNTVDNNTTNPDSGGAGWVPLFSSGLTSITGLTNANVTLSAAQYAKPIIVLTGTLTGNVQIIFPAIVGEWLVVNNTTGAFTVTCLTSAGLGGNTVILGTGATSQQIYSDASNMKVAGSGRLLNIQVITSTGTYTPTPGTRNAIIELIGGGGAGGGAATTSSGQASIGAGGASGGYVKHLWKGVGSGAVTIGAGGTGVSGATGNAGANSTFTADVTLTASGGAAGTTAAAASPAFVVGNPGAATATNGNIINVPGAPAAIAIAISATVGFGGGGAQTIYGAGGTVNQYSATAGAAGTGFGSGGAGAAIGASTAAQTGGAGKAGICIVHEFS